MKTMNLKKFANRAGVVVAGAAASVSGAAMAAVDTTAAETAINASIASAESFGTIIIGGVAALVVIGLLIGMTKKLTA